MKCSSSVDWSFWGGGDTNRNDDHKLVTINVKDCPQPVDSAGELNVPLEALLMPLQMPPWMSNPGGRSHDAIVTCEIDLSLTPSNCPQLQPQKSYSLL